jgi:hypothetical protein
MNEKRYFMIFLKASEGIISFEAAVESPLIVSGKILYIAFPEKR